MLQSLVVRLRSLLRARRMDAELDEELRYHLDREAERRVAAGLPRERAEADARRSFGNLTATREAAREAQRWPLVDELAQDIRYACRMYRRTPALAATVVLSMALAIGGTTAVISIVEAVALRDLPVPHAERLVSAPGVDYGLYERVRALTDVFEDVAAVTVADRHDVSVGASAPDPALVRVGLVTGTYFSTLGVPAAAGRVLGSKDDRVPGQHAVAVVSATYAARIATPPVAALGLRVTITGHPFTIVGVMPPDFVGEHLGRPVDVWVPTMMAGEVLDVPNLVTSGAGWLRLVARLRPGVTVEQARRAAQAPYRDYALEHSTMPRAQLLAELRRDPLRLESIRHGYTKNRAAIDEALFAVLGAVLAVLIVACANVAGLFLARGLARWRELATRAAVGAGRGRLVRQLVTESVVLAFAGGVLGIATAVWATSLLSHGLSLGPVAMDWRSDSSWVSADFRPDARVLLGVSVLCLLSGLLFGLAPAVRATRVSLVAAANQGRSSASDARSAVRRALIVVQIALALVLLVGAALVTRALVTLESRDLGVDRARTLLVWTAPSRVSHDADTLASLTHALVSRLAGLPGVTAVGVTNHGVLEGPDEGGSSRGMLADGLEAPDGLVMLRDAVTPDFFRAAGMTLVAGRGFTEHDDDAHPSVGILNETAARFFFGSVNPIGHRFGPRRDPVEIIGVVRDVKHGSPRDRRGVWYVSYRQYGHLMVNASIALRVSGPPLALASAVRRAVKDVDARLPVLRIDTVEQQLDDVLYLERFVSALSVGFALLAVGLACIGLYGVISYATSRRTNEIGVRLAFGASQSGVLAMVLRESVALVVMGIAIGFVPAVLAAHLLRDRLDGVAPSDAISLLGAVVVLMLVGLGAGFIPARRAARLAPSIALRAE